MRVLFIDICARFINPTRNLVPTVIGLAADMVCFGPGYVNSKSLRGGVLNFIEEEGPFEAVLFSPHVVFGDVHEPSYLANHLSLFYHYSFPKKDIRSLAKIAADLKKITIPCIGVLLESDCYSFSEKIISKLQMRTDAIIGLGDQYFRKSDELVNLKKEAFSKWHNDRWYKYSSENSHKIANLAHIIGENEFDHIAIDSRKNKWSVMGVDYYSRKEVFKNLKSNGEKVVREGWARKFVSGLKRIKLLRKERPEYLNYVNSNFRGKLSSARYSYTCGSGLDMPIRKYFEIPAAGAVLVCRPFTGFRQTGFLDQENSIVCEPDDIIEVQKWLESDLERAQRIANAGRKMILKNHSVTSRSNQFQLIIEAVSRRQFNGGCWEDGKFKLKHSSA